MPGVNDDELADFVRFGAERGIEVRFIEFMPFRSDGWVEKRLVPCSEMMTRLGEEFGLTELARNGDDGVARRYRVEPLGTIVGFISSLSHPFCTGRNRLRLTTDDSIKTCLFRASELDVETFLDHGAGDTKLRDEMLRAVAFNRSPSRHGRITGCAGR